VVVIISDIQRRADIEPAGLSKRAVKHEVRSGFNY
jgi:hypothetical protein